MPALKLPWKPWKSSSGVCKARPGSGIHDRSPHFIGQCAGTSLPGCLADVAFLWAREEEVAGPMRSCFVALVKPSSPLRLCLHPLLRSHHFLSLFFFSKPRSHCHLNFWRSCAHASRRHHLTCLLGLSLVSSIVSCSARSQSGLLGDVFHLSGKGCSVHTECKSFLFYLFYVCKSLSKVEMVEELS